jgi:hypothetical protein
MPVKYEGQKNEKGQAHGLGIETTDKYVYKGEFEDGKKVGIGVVTFNDKTVVKIDSSTENVTGTIQYPNGKTYAGEIDKDNFMPEYYGEYNFPDKQKIIGFFDKQGSGLGKVIENYTDSPSTQQYFLGHIENFKPNGLGYKQYNISYYYYGSFANGVFDGLGKLMNSYLKEEIIGKFENGGLNGLGIKPSFRIETILGYHVKDTGNFKNNELEGEGVRDYKDYHYVYYDEKFKEGKTSKDYKQVNKTVSKDKDKDQHYNTKIETLKKKVQTVVDNANQIVKKSEEKRVEADNKVSNATTKADDAKKVETKADNIAKKVDEAIQALKTAAKKSYEEKIADVKPKEQDRKYDILEIHDYTYAGQVNSDKKPQGYGVKTYKDKQRKMEGIFKDGLFVFGKYTNEGKTSSGFFNKGVLTGLGKDNNGAYSDIHGESVKELFSKNAAGKDKYLVAEIEKNLDNDVKEAINAAIKSAEDAAKIKFDTLIDGVVTKPDENVKVVIENKPDFTFVGQNTGYGVKTYTNGKKSRAGIFIENKLSFGESLDGDTKLYGFFKEALPYICVNEDGTPVDNQPFSDKHFLDYIGKNLKKEVETVVKNANVMKDKKEKEVADETKKAEEEKKAQDNYKAKIAEVPTEVPNPEYGIIDIEKNDIGFTTHSTVMYKYKGHVHNNQPNGYGILYNKENNQIMKGFFKEGKLFFGTKDGIGSGFFSGATFWGAKLNGFGKNNKAVFSDSFQHDSLPKNLTKFDEEMKGNNAALVKVIRDNLMADVIKVTDKANDAAKKAQAEADQKAQNEADKKAKIKKETLRLADQSAQTASQNEYDKIIKQIQQDLLIADHYVYELINVDASFYEGVYTYSGGVNEESFPVGVGKQVSTNEIYEGTFSNGKRDGLGKLVYKIETPSGWKEYYGEFKDGRINGIGVATIKSKKDVKIWSKNGFAKTQLKEKEFETKVLENLETNINKFLKKNLNDNDLKTKAINSAQKNYNETLENVKKDFPNSTVAKVVNKGLGILKPDLYLGQVQKKNTNKIIRHGYGVYENNNKIKTGIFVDDNFIFGKLENRIDKNNKELIFLGFIDGEHYGKYGKYKEMYTDFVNTSEGFPTGSIKFGDDMQGNYKILIEEVIKKSIEKDVEPVVSEAEKFAKLAESQEENVLKEDKEDKTNTGSYNWKKIGLASAAVGLGAAGIYYLHKKHKEYKQSKKSKPRGKQTRSKRSKPSNRRTRSKRSDREQRRSGSGSTRSSSRSNAENRRTRRKRSDREQRSKRSSRKTRRSSQRSSE